MSSLVRHTLTAAATLAAGLVVAAVATPASAATFRCTAQATINDVGPASDGSFDAPCSADYTNTGGFNNTQVSASASAQLGILKAAGAVSTTNNLGAGGRAYAFAGEGVTVSGLGVDGADLTFLILVNGALSSEASLPTQFYAAAASSSFFAGAYLSTDSGGSGSARLTGCARSVTSGISTCNGVFDYGPSTSETVDDVMMASIHVWNGDTLNIGMELQVSTLGYTPVSGDFAYASSDFSHSMIWGGLQFNDASRDVVLTSSSGFDYRYSALATPAAPAPEPSAWALMILGFGSAGAMLRRRRVVAA